MIWPIPSVFNYIWECSSVLLNCLQGGKKMLSTAVDFLLRPTRYDCCEFIGINTCPSYSTSSQWSSICRTDVFTRSCSATAHNSRGATCFLTTVFRLSSAKWWPSMWKVQTMIAGRPRWHTCLQAQRGCKVDRAQDAEKKHLRKRRVGKSWKDCYVKDWPSLRFVSRSSALKAEERNGERERRRRREEKGACERGGRGSKGEDAKLRERAEWNSCERFLPFPPG